MFLGYIFIRTDLVSFDKGCRSLSCKAKEKNL